MAPLQTGDYRAYMGVSSSDGIHLAGFYRGNDVILVSVIIITALISQRDDDCVMRSVIEASGRLGNLLRPGDF